MVEKLDRKEFIDLLKRMLALDQEMRITPNEALSHNFITIAHLVDYTHSLRYVYFLGLRLRQAPLTCHTYYCMSFRSCNPQM